MLVTDSRQPSAATGAYWTTSAVANALYAHIHGYDFLYAVMPETARFRDRRRGRLPTWCRLVVVAAALRSGYAWVVALDSDVVVHQPYARLHVLLRFATVADSGGGRERRDAAARDGAAEQLPAERRRDPTAIAMSNSWWSKGAPCAGNMVWRNTPLALPLLARWSRARGECRPGGHALGRAE